MNSVVLRMLLPVCRHLRNKREEEIERYAYHRQQYNNELASYRHSQCDVAMMLSKNTDYKGATPYLRLKADIEKLLETIKLNKLGSMPQGHTIANYFKTGRTDRP